MVPRRSDRLTGFVTASYQLGGSDGCSVPNRYLLLIYFEGRLALQMVLVRPCNADGNSCQDAWGIDDE